MGEEAPLQNSNRSADHDSMRGSSMLSDPDPIVRHGVSTARGKFRTAYKSNAKENEPIAELRALGVEIYFDRSSDLMP